MHNMNSLKNLELIIDYENFLHNWMIDIEIPYTLILKMLSYFCFDFQLGVPDEFWIGRQMMCWNYDKTPWEEFPDMSVSLLSAISSAKEFTLKIPPQVRHEFALQNKRNKSCTIKIYANY